MGQSHSAHEKAKEKPLKATKVFGFLFCQRYYNAVRNSPIDEAEFDYEKERAKAVGELRKEFHQKKKFLALPAEERKGYTAFTYWDNKQKAIEEEKYDEKHKDEALTRLAAEIERKQEKEGYLCKQRMDDLHATLTDAQKMYDFLQNVLCRDIRDITIMCNIEDFHRIAPRPKYAGDFYQQLFEWNYNKDAAANEVKLIKTELKNRKPEAEESWDDFKTVLAKSKWSVRPTAHEFMKRTVKEKIEYYRNQDDDGMINTNKDKPAKTFFQLECEDFWRKADNPKREMLYRKMHPLIFNRQEYLPYEKIQQDWVFQYLTDEEKRQYIQCRQPKHLNPGDDQYKKYLTEIKTYASLHKDEDILSIQTFACHGKIQRGC